ncbi:MAG: DUF481 domain-containing protein [Opitutaceae bacterium]|jgi:putative salt-induced outer membrane protein YdiY
MRLLLFFLASALIATASPTSELKLKNGDRIRGELIQKADGKIVFRSEIFGDIQVPESQVASIDPMPAASGSESPHESQAKEAASCATVPPLLAKESRSGWRKILEETKGMVELGFNDQTGRSSASDLALRASAEYVAGVDSYRVNWRYFYGHSNGILQTDRRDGSFRWRHDLKNRLFVQYVSSYADDSIKEIDINLEQSVGLGWNAYNTPTKVLNIGGGSTVQYRRALGLDEGTVILGDLFQDYSWKLSDRISFKQEASAQYSPISRSSYTIVNGQMLRTDSEATNYRFRLNAALEGKISGRLSLNLRYDYEYDNAIPVPDLKADQRISSTIGYVF